MKIFVSGCAGFLGTRICELLLARGNEVIGLDNFFYSNQQSILHLIRYKNFSFHKKDVRDENEVRPIIGDCDIIIPLAALVGANICKKYPQIAKDVNEMAIKSLCKNLSKNQKIIFPQTNSGYGIGGKNRCTEEDPLNPISLYGITKCNAEKIVLEHGNSVALRLATVHGCSARPRFDLIVNYLVSEFHFSGEITIFEPYFRRNFVHISDIARVFDFFTSNNLTGIFNVGNDDDNLTKIELAKLIANKMYGIGSEVRVKIGDGEDEDKRDYEVSSQKIKGNGFKFKYNLLDGIDEISKMCLFLTRGEIANMRNA